MVLRTKDRQDDDECSHTSDENALDQGVVWHVFQPVWCLDRRARMFTGGYATQVMNQNDPAE